MVDRGFVRFYSEEIQTIKVGVSLIDVAVTNPESEPRGRSTNLKVLPLSPNEPLGWPAVSKLKCINCNYSAFSRL